MEKRRDADQQKAGRIDTRKGEAPRKKGRDGRQSSSVRTSVGLWTLY